MLPRAMHPLALAFVVCLAFWIVMLRLAVLVWQSLT